jgi:hypothetical protein
MGVGGMGVALGGATVAGTAVAGAAGAAGAAGVELLQPESARASTQDIVSACSRLDMLVGMDVASGFIL